MIHAQYVDVKKDGEVIATWTDDSEQSLEDWKAKRLAQHGDVTFSDLQDNPEIAKHAKAKALWNAVEDPAVKQLLKPLLKEYMDEQ